MPNKNEIETLQSSKQNREMNYRWGEINYGLHY